MLTLAQESCCFKRVERAILAMHARQQR